MCIFVPEIETVEKTRIFGRILNGTQVIAYQMHLAAETPVAMILPVPVARPGGFEFIDLSAHPQFFNYLDLCFPYEEASASDAPLGRSTLPVERVGAFEASYVPTRADFERLDSRFRLPGPVWEALPDYEGWAFAVFQLAPGDQRRHPMAYKFSTREPGEVFYPTVHVHDGTVPPEATFDHYLYAQGAKEVSGWEKGKYLPGERAANDRPSDPGAGLVDQDEPLVRKYLGGKLPNIDTWLRVE